MNTTTTATKAKPKQSKVIQRNTASAHQKAAAAKEAHEIATCAFRITLTGDMARQNLWNAAALREGKLIREWAMETLDRAAKKGGVA